jgi:hypothetical protein
LTAVRKYRPIIAAVVFALYAFIATPVQVWHHHKQIPVAGTSSTLDDKGNTVSKFTETAADVNCQICSHKYSTYSDDALIPIGSSLVLIGERNGFYSPQLISAAFFAFPNKGPPSLS